MALLMSAEASRYIGYFSDADQATPAYDPGPDAPCPVCGHVLAGERVRTHSILHPDVPGLSLFYRVHRACQDGMTPDAFQGIEDRMLDLVIGARV